MALNEFATALFKSVFKTLARERDTFIRARARARVTHLSLRARARARDTFIRERARARDTFIRASARARARARYILTKARARVPIHSLYIAVSYAPHCKELLYSIFQARNIIW